MEPTYNLFSRFEQTTRALCMIDSIRSSRCYCDVSSWNRHTTSFLDFSRLGTCTTTRLESVAFVDTTRNPLQGLKIIPIRLRQNSGFLTLNRNTAFSKIFISVLACGNAILPFPHPPLTFQRYRPQRFLERISFK